MKWPWTRSKKEELPCLLLTPTQWRQAEEFKSLLGMAVAVYSKYIQEPRDEHWVLWLDTALRQYGYRIVKQEDTDGQV